MATRVIGADNEPLQPFWWDGRHLRYVDQRCLPHELRFAMATGLDDIVRAIGTAAVDGSISVDLFGAFGVALMRRNGDSDQAVSSAVDRIRHAAGAANRGVAIERVAGVAPDAALSEAQRCLDEQRNVDRAISRNALQLLPINGNIVTHGNSGALATGGSGTALGAIIEASRTGKRYTVFVSEGRPRLSGARITSFELRRAGIDTTLFADSAASWIVRTANIAAVIVGAAAIAANGDAVAEIGTYGIALAAAQHAIPLYVAAARTTLEPSLRRGDVAQLAPGPPEEIRFFGGTATSLPDLPVVNPLFDVTPGHLITAIVTEYGITRPPYDQALQDLGSRPTFALLSRSDQTRVEDEGARSTC